MNVDQRDLHPAAVTAEALAVSLDIASEWWRDRALQALLPLLNNDQLQAAHLPLAERPGVLPSSAPLTIRPRALTVWPRARALTFAAFALQHYQSGEDRRA